MLGSVAIVLAAMAMQGASDQTRAAREAYTGCLRAFVEQSITGRMTLEAFNTAYPQQCQAQQAAFRQAVIRRESALSATRANAEESATMEIDDAKLNFQERFEMAQPEPAAAPAAVAAASTPAPAPAAASATPQ